MSKAFYLTTTLPYVNADPHIGFAFELVTADIIARYRKLQGDDVFFNTGTDEHGLKIFRKAQEEGKAPQTYTDAYAAKFQALGPKLGLDGSILHFIRTTDPHHKEAAQELWHRCLAKGDIYKKKYKGLYCVGDEAFIKEGDLVDGKCPNHPTMQPIEIEEENYFFKLSAYQEKLLAYLSKEGVIIPEWRRQEAIQFVQRGLEDFSVSRVKEKMPWGVPVPDDDAQVMYVWFDALTNYISTLGWPEDGEAFDRFWGTISAPNAVQMAGKDQVRFQSIMWQAMLMSAGLPTTKQVVYHGFITSGGQKMSKSLGNVIDPIAIVDEYGTDALRYFLARHIHPFEDSDFTMEKFNEVYNADLANGLGNLVARIMKMAEENAVSYKDYLGDGTVSERFHGFPGKELPYYDTYELNKILDDIWSTVSSLEGYIGISGLDAYIQTEKPFQKIKSDKEAAKKDIAYLCSHLMRIASRLEPFMPETSEQIKHALMTKKKPGNLFPRKE